MLPSSRLLGVSSVSRETWRNEVSSYTDDVRRPEVKVNVAQPNKRGYYLSQRLELERSYNSTLNRPVDDALEARLCNAEDRERRAMLQRNASRSLLGNSTRRADLSAEAPDWMRSEAVARLAGVPLAEISPPVGGLQRNSRATLIEGAAGVFSTEQDDAAISCEAPEWMHQTHTRLYAPSVVQQRRELQRSVRQRHLAELHRTKQGERNAVLQRWPNDEPLPRRRGWRTSGFEGGAEDSVISAEMPACFVGPYACVKAAEKNKPRGIRSVFDTDFGVVSDSSTSADGPSWMVDANRRICSENILPLPSPLRAGRAHNSLSRRELDGSGVRELLKFKRVSVNR